MNALQELPGKRYLDRDAFRWHHGLGLAPEEMLRISFAQTPRGLASMMPSNGIML
jgi:hypothetical protein